MMMDQKSLHCDIKGLYKNAFKVNIYCLSMHTIYVQSISNANAVRMKLLRLNKCL